jgi:hypothetical protein
MAGVSMQLIAHEGVVGLRTRTIVAVFSSNGVVWLDWRVGFPLLFYPWTCNLGPDVVRSRPGEFIAVVLASISKSGLLADALDFLPLLGPGHADVVVAGGRGVQLLLSFADQIEVGLLGGPFGLEA